MTEITEETLDDACALLGGASTWRTHAAPSWGIPALTMSDGPNGVRGEQMGATSVPGVVIPVGIALGASWDPALVEELGALLARECRRKGVHVLLAPTVNIVRLPTGGRAFECYSEDPELTARLAVGFVRGVQSGGVAATVKHFVGNDTEVQRMTVDALIDPATRREVYLRPFEAVVGDAGVWAVMSAYNRLDGEHCAHNRWLLTDLLREEWGFDGAVISDWGGAHDTVGAAHGGLTIAMPGPRSPFGEPLAAAVRNGTVDIDTVAVRVAEVARLAERTQAAERGPSDEGLVDDPATRELCRRAAIGSMTLLRNDGVLPLAPGTRLAVIGPNAAVTRILGGGSSSLAPLPAASILDALRSRFGEAVVGWSPGASIDKLAPVLGAADLRTPDGRHGLRVELRNGTVIDPSEADPAVWDTVVESTGLLFSDDSIPGLERAFTAEISGEIVLPASGTFEVGAAIAGAGRVVVGPTVVIDDPERRLPRSDLWFGMGTAEHVIRISGTAGERIPLRITTTGRNGTFAARLGLRPVGETPPIEEAVALAATADVAVVVVGTNDEWETEGADRTTLALPGDQDELVRRVAAVAPRTVVVTNTGAPVTMPWAGDVDAVLVAGFAGLETGPAVAAILAGDADPGGRLPVTYPHRLEDSPAWAHYAPVDGVQTYGEGRLVGYRGHLASGVAPLFAFGHGLSYGTSRWEGITVRHGAPSPGRSGSGGAFSAAVSLTVTNTGERPVTDVVQVYVTHPHPEMPPMTLAGFAKVEVPAGREAAVEIALDDVAVRRWDPANDRWVVDPGPREVVVARSAIDVVARLPLTVGESA